jgi:hypothetical protein
MRVAGVVGIIIDVSVVVIMLMMTRTTNTKRHKNDEDAAYRIYIHECWAEEGEGQAV